jgi:orotidine-5'-phosphate decarboxylase
MMVAGATGPEDARRLRAAACDALFLVPGYGAQGAGARDAVAGFVRRGDRLEGGVVNASRSVASPAGSLEVVTAARWETLIDAALAAAQADLLTATRS